MATKEKMKKKKQGAPSPMIGKRSKPQKVAEEIEINNEQIEDVQGSQVSVRSAADENIRDFTEQDPETKVMKPTPSSSEPQTSNKKKKKDHVDEKLVKGKKDKKQKQQQQQQPTPQPASILKTPRPQDDMGSAVSLRSNASHMSKEAWVDSTENEVTESTGVVNVQTGSASGSVVSLQHSNKQADIKTDGLKGIKVNVDEDSPEKHAYVPYLYARNCIAKIMEDMKAMKQNHVLIVENIQTHYGEIESETQEQFNMFVLCMREEYSNKKTMFRQVIDTHKVELDKKEKYWNEMLQSLAERNNRLLKEKKMLLVHSKTEIEKLEKEKGTSYFTTQDKQNIPISSDSTYGHPISQSTGQNNQTIPITSNKPNIESGKPTVQPGNTTAQPGNPAAQPGNPTAQPGIPISQSEVVNSQPSDQSPPISNASDTSNVQNPTVANAQGTPMVANAQNTSVSNQGVINASNINQGSTDTSNTAQVANNTQSHEQISQIQPSAVSNGNITVATKELNKTGELQEQLGMIPAPVPTPVGPPQAWEEERKVLQDQLENEKATVASLKNHIASMSTGDSGGNIKMEIAKIETKDNAAVSSAAGFGAGALATAGMMAATKENNKQIEKERHEMDEERKKLAEERAKFDEERQDYAQEQDKWLNEINKLQTQLAEQSVSGNEWKVKHDILLKRLEEVADIQSKYQTLENQYAALALLVKDSDTSSAVTEHLGKTQEEKKMMNDEKTKLDADINKWEKSFEKKNGRTPTDDDKSDSIKEMYTTREEVTIMVTSLEQKESTFKQVQGGKVPEVPEISHKPIDTTVPEVVTVQVKVPDPAIVEELKLSKSEVITVKTEISTLQEMITTLRTEISSQNQQLSDQRDNIAQLEHQIAALKAEGVAAGAGLAVGAGISNEELDNLKKENRELRRDMKKMIKQYERLAARQSDGDGSPGDSNKDMAEALGQQDSKIADLEAEIESLREERLLLKEKVRTITETITVTHFEENKKNAEEKDKKIDELLDELSKLREENISMAKDMKKMVKTHSKTKVKLDELMASEKAVKLLEIVAMLVHEVHSQVPDAAGKINVRLDESQGHVSQSKDVLDRKQAAYQAWVDEFQKKHSKLPGKEDRDKLGTTLHEEWDKAKQDYKSNHLIMSALLMLKTGDVSGAMDQSDDSDKKYEIQIAQMEKALSTADNQIIDLEAKAQNLTDEKNRYKDKVESLEKMILDMEKQAEINAALMADSQSSAELTEQVSEQQKRGDSLEAELMQERMSHVNTRDEMETLRKQIDVLKEELDNEKQGLEDRVNGVKAGLEAQLEVKDKDIESLKEKNKKLEADKLSKLPPDAAAEVKKLQDQLRELEDNESSNKNSNVAMTTQIAELTSKLELANKNLETQRAANRELESKIKQNRQDKDKETKRMSRHLEEKQQKTASEDKQRIAMLVKRIKELEAKAGKGTNVAPVAAIGGSGGETLMLKREIKDQAAEIKRLEKELKLLGGPAAGAAAMKESVAEKKKASQHEKILKELEKKMVHEKDKSEKLMDGLKAADEENKTLTKELEEKNRVLTRVTAEMKTISMAAKEGVEAAAKVKTLESENKKLSDENIVLTKNFESERVLRKKYYNMVEDMKGKIRVYCRCRPMSKSELDRGNKPVCKSADEYSVNVDTSRGVKEFQYDQVFMENSTQEKIFEDTNNLIQSAVDGYNVCIFAYGQTGSGKTFTMIGDKDQRFPGIAPRAFNRIFELADELKNKFTIKIETYMLELYNDRLIDLFAKPGASDDPKNQDKLEIKKDKKGMVFVQGSVIKPARHAKELFALFEEGSQNRHTASTKMNAESSRSHLVIGVVMEATNKNTGNVTKGKLSLVDLAGSERVSKTGAGAEQLKEAMSINKSLSALGDVISALSSDQQFIPYRNNKLTMLMQDSLGGNAKTLMFVNISPADYNMDETVTSLTYASRVKLITNDASKNADNKEVARLRQIIEKMKKGEDVQEEDV